MSSPPSVPLNGFEELDSSSSDLSQLVKVTFYWLLRLRNLHPRQGKPLPPSSDLFLNNPSSEWTAAENQFFHYQTKLRGQFLETDRSQLQKFPLEVLVPLITLVGFSLNNQPPHQNTPLGLSSPHFFNPETEQWQRLKIHRERLKSIVADQHIGGLLYTEAHQFLARKMKEKFILKEDLEDEANEAILKTLEYLHRSLEGIGTLYNPLYLPRATVATWLKKFLSYRFWDQAQKKKDNAVRSTDPKMRSLEDGDQTKNFIEELPAKTEVDQSYYDVIEAEVLGIYAEELQAITPKIRTDINAQQIILSQIPPKKCFNALVKELGINSRTLTKFWDEKCVPWLKAHYSSTFF
ncbi:MAG: hypothetical protein ACO3EZ_07620 [Prochlorotrichaceae cyanobacterium]